MKKKKKKKKFKIKIFNILIALFIVCLVFYSISKTLELPITNIYIKGNTLLSDQEVIRVAKIEDYPSSITNTRYSIRKRLQKNKFIENAKVKKKFLTRVYIEIEENYPLYYSAITKKTYLKDGTNLKEEMNTILLVNEVPKKTLEKFNEKMKKVDKEIINRISEIKYVPDQVDKERFIATMADGNYVYLTLSKFNEVNNYLNYVKEFNNKKGILYLNSGEYFKIIE